VKILIVIRSLNIGGAEKQALELARRCQELGLDIHLITTHKNIQENKVLRHSFKIKNFSFSNNLLSFTFFTELIKYIQYLRKYKFDIVHSFLPEAVVLTSISKIIARDPSIHVAGVRGEYFKKIGIKEKFYFFLLRRSDAVFCNSYYLKHIIEQLYLVDSDKISVIPNGIAAPPTCDKIQSSIPKAIVVANYQPYKGYDVLFAALSLLTHPLEVHIVGRGDFEEIFKDLLNNIPSFIEIKFRGEMQVVSIYQEFDFAIHPSKYESLSNAIMEELINGLPVIAFNIGGNQELIDNEYNGFIIEKIEPNQLSEKITIFQKNPQIIKKFSRNSRIKIKEFSLEKMVQTHLLLYEDVLRKHREK